MTRANERGAQTRARLLEAGIELFHELTPAQLFEALSAKVVSRRVGMTTGAFYAHFPDHASYVDALIEYGLSRHPDEDRVATVTFEKIIAYANAPDTHLYDDIVEMLATNFRQCVEIARVYNFVFATWTRRDDPHVLQLLRRRYRLFMDDYIVGEEMIRKRWGMAFREPFTMENVAELIASSMEGCLIKHSLDPDLLDPDVFAHGVIAFLVGAMVPEGEEGGQSFLDTAKQLGMRDWEPSPDEPTPRVSDEVARAAAALLQNADMDEYTIDDVAVAAAVGTDVVYTAWGSPARLATAAFHQIAEPMRSQVQFDLDLPMPGLRALDRQLGRLASLCVELARTRPVFMSLALQGSVEHLTRASKEDGNLGRTLLPAVERARSEGALPAEADASFMARTLAFTLASRALEVPDEQPEAALATARAMVGLKPKGRGATATARRAAG